MFLDVVTLELSYVWRESPRGGGPRRRSAAVWARPRPRVTVRMRATLLLAALLATAAARGAKRPDQDFEFDDDAEASGRTRRPRKYIYDPHNALCAGVTCARRELCVLRGRAALCADRARLHAQGDILVMANDATYPVSKEEDNAEDEGEGRGAGAGEGDGDEDVFYEASAPAAVNNEDTPRCVGCTESGSALVCGSDNRTYSSLCRLDLHNCLRRAGRGGGEARGARSGHAAPVALACAGACPCAARAAPRAHRPKHGIHERRFNEISHAGGPAVSCSWSALSARLLDWFSVLREAARASDREGGAAGREGGAAALPPAGKGARGQLDAEGCLPEVRWMHAHLDADGDGLLDDVDLYPLTHDSREVCLRPFLERCGWAADGAGLRVAAWCACVRGARPCARARANAGGGGAWRPRCDADGWFRPRQCRLGRCWCVDRGGRELPKQRQKGKLHCPGEEKPVVVDLTPIESNEIPQVPAAGPSTPAKSAAWPPARGPEWKGPALGSERAPAWTSPPRAPDWPHDDEDALPGSGDAEILE